MAKQAANVEDRFCCLHLTMSSRSTILRAAKQANELKCPAARQTVGANRSSPHTLCTRSQELMRILIGLMLVVPACVPGAAERDATAIASKDSVVFHIPIQDRDAVWEWNKQPHGTVEHEWVIRMPIGRSVGWSIEGTFFIAVVQTSEGPPAVNGSVSELIKHSRVVRRVIPSDDRKEFDTFIHPTYHDGVIRVAFYQDWHVEKINRQRPADFRLQGARADGSEYHGAVHVTHLKDSREQLAREVLGPFTPDEYAIYQTVIDRAFFSDFNAGTLYPTERNVFLLNPSTHNGPLQGEESQIKILGVSDEATRDYVTKRSVNADMSSLATMGYRVADADTLYAQRREGEPWKRSVRVSAIGFNHTRDQALVYVEPSAGGLASHGEVIRLDKVDGEWLVTMRVLLWIS
jgi:hypothetical protein